MTVEDRILATLRAAGTDGMSGNELLRRVDCNRNIFKRVVGRLQDAGTIRVDLVQTEYGPTKLHTVAPARQQQAERGQLEIPDSDA